MLKRGGIKDENIVVFMFDDIAHNPENPRPGQIINRPDGPDVYQGVPKVRFVDISIRLKVERSKCTVFGRGWMLGGLAFDKNVWLVEETGGV